MPITKRDRTVLESLEQNIKTCMVFGAPTDVFNALLTEFQRVIAERDTAIADLRRLAAQCGASCELCDNYTPCPGKSCTSYEDGDRGYLNGREIEFHWTCMDIDYGDCPALEKTPCHECAQKDGAKNWKYKKVYHDAE